MPALISRAEALRRIREEVRGARLMCALRDDRAGGRWLLHEDDRALVVLPRDVRRWGQVLVLPRAHLERFAELDAGPWQHLCELARQAAQALEAALAPRRCYLASRAPRWSSTSPPPSSGCALRRRPQATSKHWQPT